MPANLRLPGMQPALAAAARAATLDPYGARRQLLRAAEGGDAPAGEVIVAGWVFSPDLGHVLLVRHPRLGWVSPGGRLHTAELPVAGAAREVREETGVAAYLTTVIPVAVLGGRYGERRYGLAWAFTAVPGDQLAPEPGQPAAWFPLGGTPVGYFQRESEAMGQVAKMLGSAAAP